MATPLVSSLQREIRMKKTLENSFVFFGRGRGRNPILSAKNRGKLPYVIDNSVNSDTPKNHAERKLYETSFLFYRSILRNQNLNEKLSPRCDRSRPISKEEGKSNIGKIVVDTCHQLRGGFTTSSRDSIQREQFPSRRADTFVGRQVSRPTLSIYSLAKAESWPNEPFSESILGTEMRIINFLDPAAWGSLAAAAPLVTFLYPTRDRVS